MVIGKVRASLLEISPGRQITIRRVPSGVNKPGIMIEEQDRREGRRGCVREMVKIRTRQEPCISLRILHDAREREENQELGNKKKDQGRENRDQDHKKGTGSQKGGDIVHLVRDTLQAENWEEKNEGRNELNGDHS